MKTALITSAVLLLAATALVVAPLAAADPVTDNCDLDPSDGFVYCHSPVGHGCVQVQLWGSPKYCTG